MVKFTDTELAGIIQREVSSAEDGTERQENAKDALDYYLGKARGDEKVGRSAVISMDVADMVNAVMATILPMISTDQVVTYEPNGQEDEDGARMESTAVNKIILEENQGVIEFQESVKDALMLRNGWTRIFIDEDVTVDHMELGEDFDTMSSEELALILEAQLPNESRELVGNNKVKRIITKRRFRMEAVPSEDMIFQQNANTMDLDKLRFVAQRQLLTRSELIEDGIDKDIVKELNPYEAEVQEASNARNRNQEVNIQAETRDQDVIECYLVYILIDMDGDGISERWEILSGGDDRQVLRKEPAICVPYATGSPYIFPHRLQGESLYDHLRTVQDSKTHALRQWSDNLKNGNNARVGVVDTLVNMDDLLESNPTGVVRMKDINAITPFMFNDVGPSAQAFLSYQDKVRSERGGAALDMLSADAQIVGDTAFGIDRQMSSREQMVSMFATNLSETLIRRTYWVMHKYLRTFSNEPINVKLAGTWQAVEATQWPERVLLNVTTGKTAGARAHVQQALLQLVQLQQQAVAQGVPLANLDSIYRSVTDWLRMAGVSAPESYLIDPSSDEAKGMIQQQQKQQQEQQEQQRAMQEQLVQIQKQMEDQKMLLDKYKHDSELEYKYYKTNVDADVSEMKEVSTNTRELEKAQIDAEHREDHPTVSHT